MKAKLETHVMSVHTKAKPYVCRYGCGSAWSDTSNRIKHERVHKANGEQMTEGLRPASQKAAVSEAVAIGEALVAATTASSERHHLL